MWKNERKPLTDFLTDMSNDLNIYMLGRIWADGHVSDTSVHLYGRVEDCENLIKYFPNQVKFYKRQRKQNGENWGKASYDIVLGGLNLKEFLEKLDFKEKSFKSPSKILSQIEKSKHYLFWRGFFDGDGSLLTEKRCTLNFWGSIGQDWGDLEELLNSLNVEFAKIKFERKEGRHKSSCLEIRKMEMIYKIMSYIYQNYEKYPLGIKRKYEMYKILLGRLSNKKTKKIGKYKGIIWIEKVKKWDIFVYQNGKVYKLGRRENEEEANRIRLKFIQENGFTDGKKIRKNYTIISK